MSKRNQVGIRLVALDGKVVERELRKFGAEGERALGRIEKASKPARRGLKSVDAAAGEVKGRIAGLASSLGPVGAAMTALGPAGVAAGAGLAALTLGVAKALSIAREAVREFDELAKRARTVGLSSDLYQALQLAADEQGVGQQRLNTALETFVVRSGEAANATGTLYAKLKQTNPALLEQFQAAQSGEERLRLLAKAVQELDSAEDKAALTAAAFGQRNVSMARILDNAAESFDQLTERARQMGLIVDEHVLKNAEEMENQFGIAARVIDLNLKQAFIDLAPVLVKTMELIGGVAKALAEFVDGYRDFEDRSTRSLQSRLSFLEARLAERQQDLVTGGVNTLWGAYSGAVKVEIAEIEAEIARLNEVLGSRKSSGGSASTPDSGGGAGGSGASKEDLARAEAIQKSILTLQERRIAALAQINELETKGLLTAEQAALARIKAEKDFRDLAKRSTRKETDRETAAMLREVEQLLSASRTPAEDLEKRLARIAKLAAGGVFERAAPGQGAEMAARARVIAMQEYLGAAEDTEEALQRIRDIAENGAGADKLAAEIALAERAGKSFGDTMKRAGEGISDSLTDAIFESRNLGDALSALARQIARDFFSRQMSGLIGNLFGGGGGGGLGGFLSGLFGGGGAGYSPGLGGGAPLDLTAAVRHDGGMVGGAGMTRQVPAALFAGAERYHSGGWLRPGERPVIGRDEEFMMTQAMQGNLAQNLKLLTDMAVSRPAVAMMPAAAPAPIVNILPQPGQAVETRESQTAGGAPQLDVLLGPIERGLAKSVKAGGPLQSAIGGAFGLNRANGLG